jgi:hypothetical protein
MSARLRLETRCERQRLGVMVRIIALLTLLATTGCVVYPYGAPYGGSPYGGYSAGYGGQAPVYAPVYGGQAYAPGYREQGYAPPYGGQGYAPAASDYNPVSGTVTGH